MWQSLIVFCIVAAAALHASIKYLPAGWRRRVVYFMSGRGARQSNMAAWFKTETSCSDGCSSCGACAALAPSKNNPKRVIKLHVLPPE